MPGQLDVPKAEIDTIKPRYNLDNEEVGLLKSELFSRIDMDSIANDAKFVAVEIDGSDRLSDLARFVEASVFVEEFGNDPELMHREYGPYEAASRFWLVSDRNTKNPIGALRAIDNSSNAGLKTVNDLNRIQGTLPSDIELGHNIDFDKTWDVGTVAVLPEYRGIEYEFMPSLALYRCLYDSGGQLGIDHFISIIDEKAESNLRLLGMPFRPILNTPSFEYLGSEHSTALYSSVTDLAEGVNMKMEETRGYEGIEEIIYKSCDALHNGAVVDDFRARLIG